jgi:signal transduction histidine kinase
VGGFRVVSTTAVRLSPAGVTGRFALSSVRTTPRALLPHYSSGVPRRPDLVDVLLALAVAVWVVAEIATGSVSGPLAVDLVCGLGAAIPLAWRRRAPVACGLLCAGALTVKTALGVRLDGLAMLVAILVAAYSVGRHVRPRLASVTVGAMVVLAWLSLFGLDPIDQTLSNYPFIALWVGGPAAAGAALRLQVRRAERLADEAARAELRHEQHAREAVRSERLRIARELHDTVAHAVSVMVLQQGAVRSRLPQGFDSEVSALLRAEDAGRQAIVELRRLLGVLRTDDGLRAAGVLSTGVPADAVGEAPVEPQPTLAQLDGLVDEARRDGLLVDVQIVGNAQRLEPAVEVSAYRIVQEALTNVRRHADARHVDVRVVYEPECLRLHVSDDGTGRTTDASLSHHGRQPGYGLVGMRERVEVYGGRLSVASPPTGGFTVDADLPLGGS